VETTCSTNVGHVRERMLAKMKTTTVGIGATSYPHASYGT